MLHKTGSKENSKRNRLKNFVKSKFSRLCWRGNLHCLTVWCIMYQAILPRGVFVISLRSILWDPSRGHLGRALSLFSINTPTMDLWSSRRRAYSTDDTDDANNSEVFVEYMHGQPHLTVLLPSRHEKCRFALKSVSHTVGDLIDMLKNEDRGIERVILRNKCDVRIASACTIESVMDEPFWIVLNDSKYKVVPPERKPIDAKNLEKLDDVRSLVAQLYEALHVSEYHARKEQELVTRLEKLKHNILPMERTRAAMAAHAKRKTRINAWLGLGLMAMQFGILARLTWWEYSWDIIEPVSYFVTYGTTMGMYAYFCITRKTYEFEDVSDRTYLNTLYRRAKDKQFDIEEYNRIKNEIAEFESDLRRLRDPLNMLLPPHVNRAQLQSVLPPKSTSL